MKSEFKRKDLKYDKYGQLKKYYVDEHGVVHEVRRGVDTAYPAPRGFSKAFNGVFYLMIDDMKCDTMLMIYGINTSHEDMVIYADKDVHKDGSRTIYTEMIVFSPVEEPVVKCTTTVLDSEFHRIEDKCFVEYLPFL